MSRIVLTAMLIFMVIAGFAQKEKDSIVYQMPMVNGRVVYTGSVNVENRSKAALDSVAEKWIPGYFEHYWIDTLTKDKDTAGIVDMGLLEFRASPNFSGLVKYKFYLKVSIAINCEENRYTYRIFDIQFRPKSRFFNVVVYHPTTPEYLINYYKKKHRNILSNFDPTAIKNYLTCVNSAVTACIASLKKAMESR